MKVFADVNAVFKFNKFHFKVTMSKIILYADMNNDYKNTQVCLFVSGTILCAENDSFYKKCCKVKNSMLLIITVCTSTIQETQQLISQKCKQII